MWSIKKVVDLLKDVRLPTDYPIKQAISIYIKRLLVVLGIVVLNILMFAILLSNSENSASTSNGTISISFGFLILIALLAFVLGLISPFFLLTHLPRDQNKHRPKF